MNARLPVLVVGAGAIGMRHVEVCAASDKVDLVGVVEPVAARRAELAAQGLTAVASLDEAPRETRAAIIASPTGAHAGGGIAALAKGWAVLVEKPIAGTLADADRLLKAAGNAGLPLVTGHHRRCHPFVAEALRCLDLIGDLVALQGLWCVRKHASYFDVPWRRQPGAGPLLTNLTHQIDMIRHLAGDIAEVTAFTARANRGGPLEDTASIALRLANGALGSFLLSDAGASPWSFEGATNENPDLAFSGQDNLRFIGSDGALEFPSLTLWLSDGSGEVEWRRPLIRQPGPRFDRVDPLRQQIDRFAMVAGGSEDAGLCTGLDGRETLAATLATALSAETGRPMAPENVPGDYPGYTA